MAARDLLHVVVAVRRYAEELCYGPGSEDYEYDGDRQRQVDDAWFADEVLKQQHNREETQQ